MTIDHNLLSHCRNLARQVAPELFERRPLYICDADLFDGLTLPTRCLGCCFTGQETFFDFRERIPSWTRPGPVIILFADAIAGQTLPEYFQEEVFAVLLHELGHCLPAREDIPESDEAELFDCQLVRQYQQEKRLASDALPDPEPGTEGDFHGIRFVRVVTHLLGRASLRGWTVSPHSLYGGAWWLPQSPHLLLPLMKEIVDFQGEPFAEILATEPPAEFTRIWQSAYDFHIRRETSIGVPSK